MLNNITEILYNTYVPNNFINYNTDKTFNTII